MTGAVHKADGLTRELETLLIKWSIQQHCLDAASIL
jgi:hypothetical protein